MRKSVLTAISVLLFAAPAAADSVPGVVEGLSKSSVTVSGTTYSIEKDTELADLGGNRIGMNELQPGTKVELDLDESGQHLILLRANLVR
jgi:hypothetical protein